MKNDYLDTNISSYIKTVGNLYYFHVEHVYTDQLLKLCRTSAQRPIPASGIASEVYQGKILIM